MYLPLDQSHKCNKKTATVQLSPKSSKLASSEQKKSRSQKAIEDSDSDKVDQLKDEYKTTETNDLSKPACKLLISENDNLSLNSDFAITRIYDEPFRFWEEPIDIEKYLHPRPRFVAYNETEEYRRECEKIDQENNSARNKNKSRCTENSSGNENNQPRRSVRRKNTKTSSRK